MFVRLIRQSVARSPRRKIMAIAAVTLASAIATAMFAVLLDIGDRVNRELRSFGANLLVTPRGEGLAVEVGGVDYRPVAEASFLPEDSVPKLKNTFWQYNITAFAPFLSAAVEVEGRRATLEGSWFRRRYRPPGAKEDLSTGLRDLNPSWQVRGDWIHDATADRAAFEVLAGERLARRLSLEPGSTVRLLGRDFVVRGVVATGGDEDDRLFARLEVVQALTGRLGQVGRIQVGALTKPEDAFARKDPKTMTQEEYDRWYCTPYLTSIAHQIQEQLPMAVARPIRRVADNEGRVLSRVKVLMLLVTAAAMAAAALMIWSTMATTVLERRGEIAIMKAVGAQDGAIAALFGVEVALQGLVGGLLGAGAGYFLARWVALRIFGSALEFAPALPLVVVVAAVGAALAGSAGPVRSALRLEVAPVLREETS
jgi:putative ABC transport system permease protein